MKGGRSYIPPLERASTHRPQRSSFLGLPYRILNMNPQKELLWGLWVESKTKRKYYLEVELQFLISEFRVAGAATDRCLSKFGSRP